MKHLLQSISKVCVFSLMSTIAWAGGDLANDLKSGQLWNMGKTALLNKYVTGELMTWVNQEKTQLRIPKPTITLSNASLGETLLDWNGDKLDHITIMIFNKGDYATANNNATISREDFDTLLKNTQNTITTLTGAKPKNIQTNRRESVVKVKGWVWQWDNGVAMLEENATRDKRSGKFEAEFIRLKLAATPQAIARNTASDRASRSDIKKNVEKTGKRLVIKNIPMVDQGDKGYCAVATAARLFSYYGMDDVDQHELASMAETSASGGTNSLYMIESLKKMGGKFQIRLRELDSLTNVKTLRAFLKQYNRIAGRMKKQKLNENSFNLSHILENADVEVMKKARAGSPSQISKWLSPIKKYIQTGVPVIWSVQLGLVPEPGLPQASGGHMRLIIGYDEEKQTIIFSDSWGAMHSEKEMPVDDAVTITTGRYIMQPSS